MDEQGAGHPGHPGHPGAQAALDEICNKISDLNKWREIFRFRGLEITTTTHQGRPGCGTDGGHGAGGAGGTPQPRCPPAVLRPPPASPSRGSQPLSLGMAMALRKVLFGDASRIFSHDWAQAHFRFREPHSDLAYALEADKGGTRAILMAVQGNIIKYLLFVRNTEYTHLERLCKISQKEQGEALAAALADSLWAAGEGREATVCLISAATHFVPTTDYKADNFTERFKSEGSKGLILFLYSLLFSRTLERVQNDLGGTTPHLLESGCGNVICTQALLQVVLAGSACPSRRCEVGFLRWSREEAGHHLPPVGSVLKTPKFPIWLCSINGMHGVLFSTNRLFLSDWKMEHVFHLYFYNGQRGQTRTAHLTVDTHSHHWEEGCCEDTSSPGKRSPSLEMAIRTRWPGASVSWNGTDPFF
ncbi:inactive ubiquitin carboxyl-terminal hydrolase MINDY-4B isoform X2 [Anas platyrhynchos]|uniref:inactive ubiquitin carboxyl-terminal hydrolase MINDY-4B isoform X2 n=1 Tax=Anas platyrhynchos TaxID=8839 RepID=UPI003AF2E3A7